MNILMLKFIILGGKRMKNPIKTTLDDVIDENVLKAVAERQFHSKKYKKPNPNDQRNYEKLKESLKNEESFKE